MSMLPLSPSLSLSHAHTHAHTPADQVIRGFTRINLTSTFHLSKVDFDNLTGVHVKGAP